MLMMLALLLMMVVCILQGVAFFTLLERHILGLTQNRYGPKKVSYYGVLQPLLDGVKLLKKENILVYHSSPSVFYSVTSLSFSMMYLEWMCLPYSGGLLTLYLSYLLLMVLVGVNVYFIIFAGIYSKSKYAFLGGMRSSVASISYEVIFSIMLINMMLFSKSYTINPMSNSVLILLFPTFYVSLLVELSRTPFDYAESESELVSGYNVEYSSVGFVLFFLKEYGSLLFFSHLSSTLFFNGHFMVTLFTFTSIILLRSSYPRVRYDKLMGLFWYMLLIQVSLMLWGTYMVLLF